MGNPSNRTGIYKSHMRDAKRIETLEELEELKEHQAGMWRAAHAMHRRRRRDNPKAKMVARTRMSLESWDRALAMREGQLLRAQAEAVETILQAAWTVAAEAGDMARLARLREAFELNGLGLEEPMTAKDAEAL